MEWTVLVILESPTVDIRILTDGNPTELHPQSATRLRACFQVVVFMKLRYYGITAGHGQRVSRPNQNTECTSGIAFTGGVAPDIA